ncbi:MAG: S8 family peptidase [Myxococcales bacterium]|nr:S8 family peptidase [Myxococcales bacterium]
MPDQGLQHILLAGTAATEQYTNPQKGGGSPKFPSRARGNHGASLVAKLESVRARAEQLGAERAAYGLDADSGICIQFESAANYDLVLESLENGPQGIELLAVRVIAGITTATVFVPNGKVSFFISRVEAYLSEDTAKGKPKNQKLVASISDLRAAVLDAFWTDSISLLPHGPESIWWEVWLRSGPGPVVDRFKQFAQAENMAVAELTLRFPGRVVLHVQASRDQMAQSIDMLNLVAELRRARIRVEEYIELGGLEQVEWVADLAGRLELAPHDAAAVCVLDTGVNHGHPLLEGSLLPEACLTHNLTWGTNDHQGHGTEIAGIALFGDLAAALESTGPHLLTHHLESVKILPPDGHKPNRPDLYGAITQEAVRRAEIAAPNRARVVCLTATTALPEELEVNEPVGEADWNELASAINEFRRRGRPSTWSAAIDSLAAGVDDEPQRLVVVAAGNTQRPFRKYYPDSNMTEGIHDPGQSWNALTISAFTDLNVFDEQEYPGWELIAKTGELAPASTTSMIWQEQWPTKPDLCLEGGNQAIDPANGEADYIDDLQLLTTNRSFNHRPLKVTGDTSAATGLAAQMAARLMTQYSELRPETVRALMVHSANWTEAMRAGKNLWDLERSEIKGLIRRVGHGVPDFGRALWSAENQLTLLAEEELQPFDKIKSRGVTKDMHIHTLPWPKTALEDLGETLVTLRVTLSYFVEPNPAERGWTRRHRYASHALRFDVKTPQESIVDFRKRISTAARAEDDVQSDMTSNDQEQWLLGTILRNKGSLHSDRWRGTAAELASRGVIGVYPVIGWWRERLALNRWDSLANYSLVVSIEAPGVDVELYTPVAQEIGVQVGVQV